MFLEEDGKLYVIEDNQVVAAMRKDSYFGHCPHPECEEYEKVKYDLDKGAKCTCGASLKLEYPKKEDQSSEDKNDDTDTKETELEKAADYDFGDRVLYKSKAGSVFSLIPSVYGTSVGIKFDDGEIGEYDPSQLSKIFQDAPVFSSNIDEFAQGYDEYTKLPAYTLEEIESKEKLAKSINVKAKAFITDKQISFTDRVRLDSIVTATAVDVLDLKESKQSTEQYTNYLESLPKFRMPDAFSGWGSLARTKSDEDISWVSNIEIEDTDWEPLLSNAAQETIENLSLEQLDDKEFMNEVVAFRLESLPTDQTERFSYLLKHAIEMKRSKSAEIEIEEPEDLDSIDLRGVFL